jgi:hypothetical protein
LYYFVQFSQKCDFTVLFNGYWGLLSVPFRHRLLTFRARTAERNESALAPMKGKSHGKTPVIIAASQSDFIRAFGKRF